MCTWFSGPTAHWKKPSNLMMISRATALSPCPSSIPPTSVTVPDFPWGALPVHTLPHFALILAAPLHLLSSSWLQSPETRECGPSGTVTESGSTNGLHQPSEKSVFGNIGQEELLLLHFHPVKSEPEAAHGHLDIDYRVLHGDRLTEQRRVTGTSDRLEHLDSGLLKPPSPSLFTYSDFLFFSL